MTMFREYDSMPKRVSAARLTEENKDMVFNELTGQHASGFEQGQPIIKVKTVHGETAIIRIGDWIVRDRDIGTYYPVKDDVFVENYSDALIEGT